MKRLAQLFCVVTVCLVGWRLAPPSVHRAAAPLGRQLYAELRPLWYSVEDRLKQPEADPASRQPSAAGLAAPTGPARHRPAGASAQGDGEKAPMLNEKGVALDQELHGALGAPVLTEEPEIDRSRALANRLIAITGTLAVLFMAVAWFKGDPRSKTLA